MIKLFVLSVCFFIFAHASDSQALTIREQIKVSLIENLILSTATGDTHADTNPLLSDKDLCLAKIYKKTGSVPLWVSEKGPGLRAQIIFDFLKKSDQEGLDSSRYDVKDIANVWSTQNPPSLARLDLLLTYNLAKYIHDISFSRIRPLTLDLVMADNEKENDFNVVDAIQHARTTSDLSAFLTSLAPSHQYYQGLKKALKIYRAIAQTGGWQTIPSGPTLHPGDQSPRVENVYKRLLSPGISGINPPHHNTYDHQLQKAVRKFQELNGLKQDGIVGPQTLATMNIPASHLVDQIIVNMARWRRQAHVLGSKYVMINIADFSLEAFKNKRMILNFPVIIGQRQHQTPVFSDSIKYIEFNPFWNIPTSIAKNEELPNLRKNPRYLVERHVRLFTGWDEQAVELDSTAMDWKDITASQIAGYRLRQDPGPWNALGRVKFGFPNTYSVYMHDTPAKDLFSKNKRDFSHGCIRLSNPLALAIFALEDQGHGWTPEKVEKHFFSDKRMIVLLKPPLPIHITYQTSWVDKNGLIHFNRDIYDRDALLIKDLNKSNDKVDRIIENTPAD